MHWHTEPLPASALAQQSNTTHGQRPATTAADPVCTLQNSSAAGLIYHAERRREMTQKGQRTVTDELTMCDRTPGSTA